MAALGKPAPSSELLTRLGLGPKDVSAKAASVLAQLVEERDALAVRLSEAEEQADCDPLTACRNRRAFMRELFRTMSAMERYGTPAAVLYIDLDGFKAINDGFGHAAGDAVLKHIGRLLIAQVRESDVAGRLGGDEFGIILNHVSAAEADVKAAALEQAIQATHAVHAGKTHRVMASVGVHIIASVEDPEIALARADEAMYAGKHRRKRMAEFPEF